MKAPQDLIDAIESGRYPKGQCALATPRVEGGSSYCCLGVASAEVGYKAVDLWDEAMPNTDIHPKFWVEYPWMNAGLDDRVRLVAELMRVNDFASTWEPVIEAIRAFEKDVANGEISLPPEMDWRIQ